METGERFAGARASELSGSERRLLAKILAGLSPYDRHLVSDKEAEDVFRRDYAAFKPGYTAINIAVLVFIVPVLLSHFLYQMDLAVRLPLVVIALILVVVSLMRLQAFKQQTRSALGILADQNRHKETPDA